MEFPMELVDRFVCQSGSGEAIVDQAPIEILPEEFARLPEVLHRPGTGWMLMVRLQIVWLAGTGRDNIPKTASGGTQIGFAILVEILQLGEKRQQKNHWSPIPNTEKRTLLWPCLHARLQKSQVCLKG